MRVKIPIIFEVIRLSAAGEIARNLIDYRNWQEMFYSLPISLACSETLILQHNHHHHQINQHYQQYVPNYWNGNRHNSHSPTSYAKYKRFSLPLQTPLDFSTRRAPAVTSSVNSEHNDSHYGLPPDFDVSNGHVFWKKCD